MLSAGRATAKVKRGLVSGSYAGAAEEEVEVALLVVAAAVAVAGLAWLTMWKTTVLADAETLGWRRDSRAT
jgi:hypothetical protein